MKHVKSHKLLYDTNRQRIENVSKSVLEYILEVMLTACWRMYYGCVEVCLGVVQYFVFMCLNMSF